MSRTNLNSYGIAIQSQLFAQFQPDPDNFSGLTFAVKAGLYTSGDTSTEIAADTVVLTDDATNYVWLDSTNAIAGGTSIDSDAKAILFEVTTASGVITAVEDLRGVIL